MARISIVVTKDVDGTPVANAITDPVTDIGYAATNFSTISIGSLTTAYIAGLSTANIAGLTTVSTSVLTGITEAKNMLTSDLAMTIDTSKWTDSGKLHAALNVALDAARSAGLTK